MTRVQARVQSNLRDNRPTCYKLGLYLCASCVQDLAISRLTSNFQAFKEKFRKFQLLQHDAMQVGTTHAGIGSDLAMAKATLWAEFRDMVLKLIDIEQTNSALYARLMAEAKIRSDFMINAASTDIVRHYPPSHSI